ncbi:MAG: hypothetical protein NTW50_05275 [Candidatus Berkelbacteria bacterium]|nr:hypothetical protein [Candidatus Berkelbacteria bacterium]
MSSECQKITEEIKLIRMYKRKIFDNDFEKGQYGNCFDSKQVIDSIIDRICENIELSFGRFRELFVFSAGRGDLRTLTFDKNKLLFSVINEGKRISVRSIDLEKSNTRDFSETGNEFLAQPLPLIASQSFDEKIFLMRKGEGDQVCFVEADLDTEQVKATTFNGDADAFAATQNFVFFYDQSKPEYLVIDERGTKGKIFEKDFLNTFERKAKIIGCLPEEDVIIYEGTGSYVFVEPARRRIAGVVEKKRIPKTVKSVGFGPNFQVGFYHDGKLYIDDARMPRSSLAQKVIPIEKKSGIFRGSAFPKQMQVWFLDNNLVALSGTKDNTLCFYLCDLEKGLVYEKKSNFGDKTEVVIKVVTRDKTTGNVVLFQQSSDESLSLLVLGDPIKNKQNKKSLK